MTGVRGQTGVVDVLDLVILVQIQCDLLRALRVARNAQLKSFESAQDEPCLERSERRAGHILKTEHLHAGYKLCRAYDKSGDNVAVAVEVLGCRVDDNVRAELEGILQGGGGKGIVADDLDIAVIFMRGLCQKLDVGYLEVRVCRCFQVNGNGVFLKICLEILNVTEVCERNLNAVLCHAVVKQSKGAAV